MEGQPLLRLLPAQRGGGDPQRPQQDGPPGLHLADAAAQRRRCAKHASCMAVYASLLQSCCPTPD